MTDTELKLLKSFPGSFINDNGKFIPERSGVAYFDLANCESSEEIKCKVLEWCSRAAYKSEPYDKRERMIGFMSLCLMASIIYSTLTFQKKIWS